MLPTSKKQFYIVVAVVLVIGVALGCAGARFKNHWKANKVVKDTYQAIYLDNNQQYFGHLKGLGTRQVSLTDVYYVKNEPTEPGQPPRFNLVKLVNELHGPEDEMYLNWSKIILWQNLKKDSQIVMGIAKEKASRGNLPPAAVTPPPPVSPVK